MNYLELKFKKISIQEGPALALAKVTKVSSVTNDSTEAAPKLYLPATSQLAIPNRFGGLPVVSIIGALVTPDEVVELILPNEMRAITPTAFFKNEIEHLHIGKHLQVHSFMGNLRKLRKATLHPGNMNYEMVDGSLYELKNNQLVWTKSGKIKEGTRIIGPKAFNGFGYKNEVFVPDSVTVTGEHAFFDCDIRKLSISGNIETVCAHLISVCYIGELEFRGSKNKMSKINLSNYAIDDSRIDNLIIHENVGHIGSKAFAMCDIKSMELRGGTFEKDSFAWSLGELERVSINAPDDYIKPKFYIEELDKLIESTPTPATIVQVDGKWSEIVYW